MPIIYNDYSFDTTNEKLINILTSQADIYAVQRGYFYRTDPFDLCDDYMLPSCFGNNSGSPYFSCAMEDAPGQSVPSFVEVASGKYLSFRMGFNEAIIITGKTPPEVKYFSYCAFVTTRHSKNQSETAKHFKVMPLRNKPTKFQRSAIERDLVFTCLGEPINNLKINTPGTPEGAPGCPYDQPFLLIFTGNQNLQQEIYKSALQAGYSPNSLNMITMPRDIANFGVAERSTDTFSLLARISSESMDEPDMKKYLLNPEISVVRITANTITGPALPIPYLTPRGTGTTEFRYSKAIDTLRDKIVEHYSNDYDAVDIPTDIWLDESYIAIQQGVNDLGESRDTVYFGSGSFKLPEDAFIVVYGANHAKTGKCTYCNAVVYGQRYENGVVSASNKEFENSALLYLEDPKADYLYAYKFGYYDDPSEYYKKIPSYDPEEDLPCKRHTSALDPNEEIFLGFRAYLEPTTKVGPAWNELALDKVIVFLKK